MALQAFIGFAPDMDPDTPGVITDISDYLPTLKGYTAAYSNASAGYNALAASCSGAALCVKLDGTTRLFAGTSTHLYEGDSAPGWTDRSKGGGYSGSSDHRWAFAQFGDTSLAALKSDTLQSSNAGVFADVAAAEKARFVETVPGFVMLADCNDVANGDQPDRWKCSAFNDYTSWAPSVATQANTGRLVGSPGPIRGWKRLGDDIIAYKERSIYVGRYVGAPDVFDFTLLPGEIGCGSNEAIVNIGTNHIFLGYDDFYVFDGSRPISIGTPIKKWFFNNLNKQFRYRILGLHDRVNSLVLFFYPSNASASGVNDSAVVYNYKTDKWGTLARGAEAVVEVLTGQVTYANIGNYFASYTAINVSYDSPFWTANYPSPAIFDTSNVLQLLTGAPGTCYIKTGNIGDDDNVYLLSRVRPRFSTAPTSATLTNYYRMASGANYTTDQTLTMSNGKVDILRSARWHQLKLTTSGSAELSGIDPTLTPDGTE